MGRISSGKWFLTFSAMALASMPLLSHSGDAEDMMAAECGVTAAAASAPGAVAAASCFGKKLFMQEVEKCLTGGDCLGESNDIVGCNGWLMTKVFGGHCNDPAGPGFITFVNHNPYTIRFYVSSATGPTNTIDLGPNMFWTTRYEYVNYRMNWANGSNDQTRYRVFGNVLHNGSSYRFTGSQVEPELACLQPRNRPINDPRDPCNYK